ncbi:MAG: endonuclease/exonuclease/phosphatase family protein [Bacteroidetes bacterium]|nr:endonuclease/exonuclease/phosphatase family protein [Bacteroidota bacterium]
MRNVLIISFVFLVLAISLQAQKPQEFVALSWNIRLDTPYDGANAWAYRKEGFCNHLKAVDADVYGFQEVLHNQLLDLKACLNGYNFVGVGRTDGKTAGEYSPLFYRAERFDCIESGTKWLSPAPDQPGSVGWDAALERIVTYARLVDRLSGDTLMVMNTHFDHVGQKAREQSALLLMSFWQQLAGKGPAVIMGDINSDIQNPAYQVFMGAGLEDARQVAGQQEAMQATYTGFDDDPANDALIDFIFHSAHYCALAYQVQPVNHGGSYLSDHLPVVARMKRIAK